MNRSSLRWWLPGAALTVLAAGEWLRAPAPAWIVVGCVGALIGLAGLRPWGGWRQRAVGLALALLALAPLVTAWRLDQVERHWPALQAARVQRATDRLAGDLHAAFLLASRLADLASAAPADPIAAFDALERAVAGAPIEAGVALLGQGGRLH
ncbi:MAG TPA: hypothetical protein PK948_05040, partial [Gemmatimonadales bacterium]|nr:hypothetical protein [Gemmatimonadales bacterium]